MGGGIRWVRRAGRVAGARWFGGRCFPLVWLSSLCSGGWLLALIMVLARMDGWLTGNAGGLWVGYGGFCRCQQSWPKDNAVVTVLVLTSQPVRGVLKSHFRVLSLSPLALHVRSVFAKWHFRCEREGGTLRAKQRERDSE